MKTAAALNSPTWQAIALRSAEPGTPHGNWMEHRWGPRRPCRAQVSVSAGGGVSGLGQLKNVSMSGAFLETPVPLPLFAQLAIAVLRADGTTHPLEFTAVVVRHDGNGVGIEWCDPSPGSICSALDCGIDCGFAKGSCGP